MRRDLVQPWAELIHRLKQLRVAAGMSGLELAERQGWSQSKVSKIETGKAVPMPDDVRVWAESMGVSPKEVEHLVSVALEVKMNPPDRRVLQKMLANARVDVETGELLTRTLDDLVAEMERRIGEFVIVFNDVEWAVYSPLGSARDCSPQAACERVLAGLNSSKKAR